MKSQLPTTTFPTLTSWAHAATEPLRIPMFRRLINYQRKNNIQMITYDVKPNKERPKETTTGNAK